MYDYYGKIVHTESTPTAPAIVDYSPFKITILIGDTYYAPKNQYEYNHILRYGRKVQKMKNCINDMHLYHEYNRQLIFKIDRLLCILHDNKHNYNKKMYDFKTNIINEYTYKNSELIRSTNKHITNWNIQKAKINMINHIYKPLHRYDFGRKNDIRYEQKQLEYYAMIAHQNILILCTQLEHSYNVCEYVFNLSMYRCI